MLCLASNNPGTFVDPSGLQNHYQDCMWEPVGDAKVSSSQITNFGSDPNNGIVTTEDDGPQGYTPVDCMGHSSNQNLVDGTYHVIPFSPTFISMPAPNNRAPRTPAQCSAQALNKNKYTLGLDAAGFIPGEKLLGATAGVVTMVGIGVTSTVNSAVNGDLKGSLSGIAGTQLAAIAPAAKYAGVSFAESIPGIGTLLNVGVSARDAFHTYQDYLSCMAGH